MKAATISLLSFSLCSSLFAGDAPARVGDSSKEVIEISFPSEDLLPEWGVAMAVRQVRVPFSSADKSKSDIFPLFYYEGERFFLRGDNGGVKLWKNERFGINALARYRFYDIPEEHDGNVSGGGADMGLQVYWKLTDETQLQFEVLSDAHGRMHSVARWAGDYRRSDWRWFPEIEMKFTGEKYNSQYYGVGVYDLDQGVEVVGRLKARRRVVSNLFLEGRVEAGWVGQAAKRSPVVEDDFKYELYLGFGFFSDEPAESTTLKAKPYWRLSQGWGTDTDFQNILMGQMDTDAGADVNTTSIFYGHPLADSIFGVPIEMYLTGGVIYNYSSSVQDSSMEFVMGVKGYYTFATPWRLRLGFAEGISYADSLTYYEEKEMTEKGVQGSALLNYLDLSLDMNMGDVFKSEKLDDLWLGAAIHHRSGLYGNSSAFGNVSGGTNFIDVYLQWHGGF